MSQTATKRLLLVSSFAESLVNFRLALMQDAVTDGFEVHACGPDITDEIATTLKESGIHVHTISLSRNGLNPLADLSTLWSIFTLIRNIKPTHVLGYTIKPVIYGSLAARLAGVKRIGALITGLGYAFMQSNSLTQRLVGGIARSLYRVALSGASVVFFQNTDDRDLFTTNKIVAAQKCRLVNGSGIDIKAFAHSPLPESTSVEFLMIGRIIADIGVREYAAAAQQVRAHYPNARFHLVGWLDTNPSAIQQAELDQWIANGAIQYHGKLSDVRQVIKDCHVYVLPSYREGTPRTVLEAMAIGRAIITTDAPGCRETIQDEESGFLVPVADVDALVNAMQKYLQSPQLMATHGQSARHRAVQVYDVKKVNQDMLKGLQE